MKVVSCK